MGAAKKIKTETFVETEDDAAIRTLKGLNYDQFASCAVLNNQVIGAIYDAPDRSKGGILFTDNRRGESEFQGKVLLIIAAGPSAFSDESGQWFQGRKPKIGDWVVIRASDGWRLDVHGVKCRMFDDTLTRMIVPHPEVVW